MINTKKNVAIDQLAKYKNLIDSAINIELTKFIGTARPSASSNAMEALSLLVNFANSPAKRIRGALAWHTYNSLNTRPNGKNGAKLAVAVELVQDYLLIVDDVMDKSIKRRGLPTIQEIYKSRLQGKSTLKNDHLANMLAINVGLLAQHIANKLILECQEKETVVREVLRSLHKNIIITSYGQIDDLLYGNGQKTPNMQEINAVYESKSSYYTFINPIQMGAALAGNFDSAFMQSVIDFGRPAGFAYQLKDDLLGMFGESKITGKPNMDDLREGKRTLLILTTLSLAKKVDKEFILNQLGNQNLSEDNFLKVRNIIDKCGAKLKVEQETRVVAKRAMKMVDRIQIPYESKQFFSGIVDYSVNRKW